METTTRSGLRGFVALFGCQVLLNVLVVAQERAAATVAFLVSDMVHRRGATWRSELAL